MGEFRLDISENLVSVPGGEILFARLASNLLQSGEIDEAKKLCERGLKKYPAYAQAHYILAKCYLRKNMSDEARKEMERVLRYDANHIKAIRDLAGIYLAADLQDQYKEYLLKLYTLDPLNGAVIEEFKKSGLDEIWSNTPEQETESKTISRPSSAEIESKGKEELSIDTGTDKLPSTDPLFTGKLDLSQFDNLEDDFTTILHGNLESPATLTSSNETDENQEQTRDDDIFEISQEEKKETKTTIVEDHQETMDAPAGEDEEPAHRESEDSKFSESEQHVSDKNQIEDELERDLTEIDEIDLKESSPSEQNQVLEDEMDVTKSTDAEAETKQSEESDSYPGDLREDEEKFEQPKIISQTLGEILVSQKKYVEAKAVFEALKEKQPENKSLDVKIVFLEKIIGLEKK